jgi:hypothetical protein
MIRKLFKSKVLLALSLFSFATLLCAQTAKWVGVNSTGLATYTTHGSKVTQILTVTPSTGAMTISSDATFTGDLTLSGDIGLDGVITFSDYVNIDSDLDIDGGLDVSGTSTLATVDIDAGAIDGTIIGANSAAAGTFAAINGTSISIGASGSEVTITSTPAILNEVTYFPGMQSTAAIDFNAVGTAAMNVTINSVIYLEADTADATNGVWTNGSSAADSAASLILAINGDTRAAVPFTAYADATGDGVILIWDAVGNTGNVTITSSDGSATTATSVGGENAGTKQVINVTRTITTNDLLAGVVTIPVPFVPTGFNVNAVSSSGVPVYFTDAVTIGATPNRILITTAGGTNLANTDVVHLTVWE